MKRIFCCIFCLLFSISLCACKSTETVLKNNSSTNQPSLDVESIYSEPQNTNGEKNEESSVPNNNSESPQGSQETPLTSSEPEVKPQPVEPPKTPDTVKIELSQQTYTVNDVNNTRGLSTKQYGFSYGIAKDGVAHNQSFVNQQTFDAFEKVDALALDTKTQEKIMYLTFDNGYEYNNLTADILDTLKEKDVKAAFFVTLSYVKQNPELVKRMIDEGHIVGNHSTTHPVFPTITRLKMAEEIATLDNYLRENFNYTSPYFRFPTGAYSECSLELVTSIGFKSVFWSLAHADWDTANQKGAEHAFSTVTSRFHKGAVILLHAVSQDNADALSDIIDEAHNQGYSFKTLDDYFK